jgi:hypothetical protein
MSLQTTSPQSIERAHIPQKRPLPTKAGVPYPYDFAPPSKPVSGASRLGSYRYQAARLNKKYKLEEQRLPRTTLLGTVGAIAELITRLMGMKGKDIPQEDWRFELLKHAPDRSGGALGDGVAHRWPLGSYPPSCSMGGYVHIIGECQTGTPSATVAKVPADPD